MYVVRYNTLYLTWLGTGSNPADINRFRSHTGNYFPLKVIWSYFPVTLQKNLNV